jgi:hypothetical protein
MIDEGCCDLGAGPGTLGCPADGAAVPGTCLGGQKWT